MTKGNLFIIRNFVVLHSCLPQAGVDLLFFILPYQNHVWKTLSEQLNIRLPAGRRIQKSMRFKKSMILSGFHSDQV